MNRNLLPLLVLFFAACDAPPGPPATCQQTSECAPGYHCSPAHLCKGDIPCAADGDCCLGERCEALRCRPREWCTTASPCIDPATTCASGVCVPRTCSETQPCPQKGGSCLWGRCVRATPCAGQCPSGSACAVAVGRCVPVPTPPMTCGPGQLRVLANDVERLAEGCSALPQDVTCNDLPPLPEGQYGVPNVLLRDAKGLVVIAYDRTYGDVVLARHAATPPFARLELRTLTGVPAGGAVIGDPGGPRGGVADPGPDRGSALDAAVDAAGRIHVAYRDKTSEELRYLMVAADGTVSDSSIAKGVGLGTALSLALRPEGTPVVAAFAPAHAESADAPSHLRVYAALKAAPAAAADWAGADVDSETVAKAPLPCAGACPSGKVCAAPVGGGGEACTAPATGCSGCLPTQICSNNKCMDIHPPPANFDDVAPGRGSWLDLAVGGNGDLLLAAYSATSRDLAIYRGKSTGSMARKGIDRSAVPGGSSDFGRFAALLEGDAGRIWVACEDSQRGRLLLVRETDSGSTIDLLDDGVRSDGRHRVGADVRLVRHNSGALLAAYQDTRRGQLIVARLPAPGAAAERTVLSSGGAAGFSPSLVSLGGKAWVVAAATLRVEPDASLRDEVELHDLVWNGN